jgi:hypothetical protein
MEERPPPPPESGGNLDTHDAEIEQSIDQRAAPGP